MEVKKSYDAICEEWSKVRDNSPVNQCVVEFVQNLQHGARILDVGCGTGAPIDVFLANKGFVVHGIDVSSAMIAKAKRRNLPNVTFEESDFLQFFSTKKYHAIIAFDSLWHLPRASQKFAYQKLSKLLLPNGLLLLTAGIVDGETVGTMFGQEFYYSSLDVPTLLQCLDENGFDVLECHQNYKEKTTGERDLLLVAKLR